VNSIAKFGLCYVMKALFPNWVRCFTFYRSLNLKDEKSKLGIMEVERRPSFYFSMNC
jgi:hypothetical protein